MSFNGVRLSLLQVMMVDFGLFSFGKQYVVLVQYVVYHNYS